MSFDALITGKLRGAVTVKAASNGNPYARWTMGINDKNGASLLASCISFHASVIDVVQALADGDSVAVSGECAINQWDGRDGQKRTGLDVQVHIAMSAYHLGRKRKAMGDDQPQHDKRQPAGTPAALARSKGTATRPDDSAARAFGYTGSKGLDDGEPLDF